MFELTHNLKIFNRIIARIPVNMMNDFRGVEKSFEMFFHHKSMLHHIALAITKRMKRCGDSIISAFRSVFNSTLISRMISAAYIYGTPYISACFTAKSILRSFIVMPKKLFLAHWTDQRFFSAFLTPSMGKITFRRTKSRIPTGVFLGEMFPAFFTNKFFAFFADILMPRIGDKKPPAFATWLFSIHSVPPFPLIYNNSADKSRTIYKYCAIAQKRVDAELAQTRLAL